MLKSYLTIALRSLRKQKLYAFINVFGLAVGIAFCALIYLYVQDELTFDRFHEQGERIFRVTLQDFEGPGQGKSEHPWQPLPLAEALVADLPEVERAVRFFNQERFVRRGGQTFEEPLLFADGALFEVFTFPLLRGDPATALDDPNSVVLSAQAAEKYFGEEDPLGQTVEVRFNDTFEALTVTGVAAPILGNSSIRFDFLLPFAKTLEAYEWIRNRQDRWNASSFFVYVALDARSSLEAVSAKLPAFRARYFPNEAESVRREQGADALPPTYRLQPLHEIHLDPSVQPGLRMPSDPRYSYLLGGIALAILLIACINFTTLAIGRSAGRAREVGVRKVVGAQRRQLMLQFWGEAVLMSLLALAVGIALAELFLPTFNTLAAKTLHFEYLKSGATVAMLVGLMLGVGLLAGGYPALVLSGLRPVETLKQRLRLGGANALTKSLVVVQFALSVFLIIGTLVMVRQLDYLQTKNLGFNKEHVVVIPTSGLPGDALLPRFRQALEGRDDVVAVTGMNNAFAHGWSREGWDYRGDLKRAYVYAVDPAFLDVMEMELVAGRRLDPTRATDPRGAVLVNEALVRDFGWTDPLGQQLEGFYEEPVVVGVLRDVNNLPLHREVEPMIVSLHPEWGLNYFLVRLAPTDVPATLDALETAWQAVAADVPFQYSFLDDDFDRMYASEQRWSRIVGYGAGFAVLIACLGLFGLAALSVAGRTKEIGIRRVFGASVGRLVVLLSKDFVRLVAVAVVLAAPLAYFAMQTWLEGFAYRIAVSWQLFLLVGALALTIALLTVSYQAIKAARANPVKSLRYE